MPQIKKILFPVDFSNSSTSAARYVEAFAGQFEAEIMLLHAVGMGERSLPEELMPHRKALLEAFLPNELKYFTIHRVCTIGEPSPTIAETARTWCPDLVMLPTHGLGFFRRNLLGSVAAQALKDLSCPVWTSVHAESAPPLEDIHCRRILCSVDLSESSRNILEYAAWLACEYDAGLGIVHATPAIDTSASGFYVGDDLVQQTLEAARTRIETLKDEAGVGDAQVFINVGAPETIVAAAAKDFGADLLVVGRHSDTGVAGELFEHAYSILSASPCPVISI